MKNLRILSILISILNFGLLIFLLYNISGVYLIDTKATTIGFVTIILLSSIQMIYLINKIFINIKIKKYGNILIILVHAIITLIILCVAILSLLLILRIIGFQIDSQ